MRNGRLLAPGIILLLLLAIAVAVIFARNANQGPVPLMLWSRFNTNDPQVTSDIWLANTIRQYEEDTGITVSNTFYPYDQINATLNVAVLSGDNVPDVAYVSTRRLGFYYNTGSLIDLTDFVTGAEWFDDLDPAALRTCVAPDGSILCVPHTVNNFFTYYWTDVYADGYPATTEELLEMAPAIKAAGYYPITFKASEGAAVDRVYYPLMASFGAQLADEDGRAIWANAEAVRAVEFIRELFVNEYVPDVALAPGFEFEEPFKQGSAGGFVAGSFSYVYLTPLESPEGELFEKEITGDFDPNALAVGEAFAVGELALAPPLAAPGGEPVSFVSSEGWAIPFGSQNIEGAKNFIDYQMTTTRNLDAAIANGQFPSLRSALADGAYASEYWQTAAAYKEQYGRPAPGWLDHDMAIRLLSDAIVRCIINPDLDILEELRKAQDEYNLGIEN